MSLIGRVEANSVFFTVTQDPHALCTSALSSIEAICAPSSGASVQRGQRGLSLSPNLLNYA